MMFGFFCAKRENVHQTATTNRFIEYLKVCRTFCLNVERREREVKNEETIVPSFKGNDDRKKVLLLIICWFWIVQTISFFHRFQSRLFSVWNDLHEENGGTAAVDAVLVLELSLDCEPLMGKDDVP